MKVDVCHATGNGGGVTVEVDADAWAEHTSAHSEHELDFLIDEGHPCPPVPDPIPDPDPTPTPDPLPPVLADLCVPVAQLDALAEAHVAGTIVGSVDVALANDGYALVTFEREGDNGPYIQSLGGVTPETDNTPCPTPIPPATDTPRPDDMVPPAAPVIEVSDAALEQQADTFAAGAPQAEVEAPTVAEGQLPYTGINDWLAPVAGFLLAAGAFLLRRFRSA